MERKLSANTEIIDTGSDLKEKAEGRKAGEAVRADHIMKYSISWRVSSS